MAVSVVIPVLSALAFFSIWTRILSMWSLSGDRFGNAFVFVSVFGFLILNFEQLPGQRWIRLMLALLPFAVLAYRLLGVEEPRRHRRYRADRRLLVVAGLTLWLGLVNTLRNPELPLETLAGRLLAGLYLTAFAIALFWGEIQWKTPMLAFIGGTLFMNALGILAGEPWRDCDQFKCGPFGALYLGGYATENSLAMFSGAAFVIALGTLKGVSRILVTGSLGLALYATESRTAQLATMVAILSFIVVNLHTSWRTSGPGSQFLRRVGIFALLTVMASGLYVVLTSASTDFSNRGNTWGRGMAALGSSWPTGLGIDRWLLYQQVGLVPPLFPHSEYLLVLFGGGIGAIVLLAMALVAPFRKGNWNANGISVAVAFVCYLAVTGITEVYWNPLSLDAGSAFALVLIACCFLGPQSRGAPSRREALTSE